MNEDRLQEILNTLTKLRIVVCGDFFLDRYVELDPLLNEISIETGKTAYQVVGKRPQPGAAGTICNNLVSLGVKYLFALTVIGNDGEGHELTKALESMDVDTAHILSTDSRFTPTYMKPMLQKADGEEELERMDTKNRSPLARELEDIICERLESFAGTADILIISDQVQERNCGVITDRVRNFLSHLAEKNKSTIFFVDSRERIGEFKNVCIKPNRSECINAIEKTDHQLTTDKAIHCARQLYRQNGKPVFLTLDKEGICPVTNGSQTMIPCPPVNEPIDI
ncbi:carbohydrate kinase, partial [bacterium]|nr:carbohydrate kinase [bacterium]